MASDGFGFTSNSDDDDSNQPPSGMPPGFGGPGGLGGFGGPGGFDMASLGSALQQLGSMLQSGGAVDGPVNWELAATVARQAVAQQGDKSTSASEERAVHDALELADIWLDPATDFPAAGGTAHAWSRAEWIENTLPAWKDIVAPVAEHLQTVMAPGTDGSSPGVLPGMPGLPGLSELGDSVPPELASMLEPLMGMAKAMSSSMFGAQLGQGLAALAQEVVSATDIGIPLAPAGSAALLPANVKEYSQGLELPDRDVLIFLAVREAAHQRLFAHVSWLRSRVAASVEAYARGIRIDTARIEEAMRDVDINNPQAIQEVLSSGVFEPHDTEEQKAALVRLETLLALIEGWVDDVTAAAVGDKLPSFPQLQESLRRRRASGGPAEKTFANLVGLEMRPRKLREAAELWQRLRTGQSAAARDALWNHPDLLPTAEDLEDVDGFVLGNTGSISMEALEAFEASQDSPDTATAADGGQIEVPGDGDGSTEPDDGESNRGDHP